MRIIEELVGYGLWRGCISKQVAGQREHPFVGVACFAKACQLCEACSLLDGKCCIDSDCTSLVGLQFRILRPLYNSMGADYAVKVLKLLQWE